MSAVYPVRPEDWSSGDDSADDRRTFPCDALGLGACGIREQDGVSHIDVHVEKGEPGSELHLSHSASVLGHEWTVETRARISEYPLDRL